MHLIVKLEVLCCQQWILILILIIGTFGDTFFFSELSAYLHEQIGELVSSVILVSDDPEKLFGDLYEIKCRPYEIFVNAATTEDIVIVPALTPATMQS